MAQVNPERALIALEEDFAFQQRLLAPIDEEKRQREHPSLKEALEAGWIIKNSDGSFSLAENL